MLKIAFHECYKYQLPDGHRFPMVKYDLIPEQLLYEGTVSNDNFFVPEQMGDEDLFLTHSEDYLTKLNNQTLDTKEIKRIGFPMSKALVDRGKHIANGTYQCALHAFEHKIAMNIAGGTHHSFKDFGEGFCVFNDIAIASNLLLHKHGIQKILIVDVDVHQGNGTAKIFENEDRVFTFSMHGEKNFPTRKEKSNLDIGLPDKTDDQLYLSTLKNSLPKIIDEVQPEFIFYLSGVDIIESDKLGRLSVSKQGCKERDRFSLDLFKKNDIPVAVSMGGGYSHKLADIVDCHANTFRVAQDLYF